MKRRTASCHWQLKHMMNAAIAMSDAAQELQLHMLMCSRR